MNTKILLRPELLSDPDAVGYSAMSDQECLDSLNVRDIIEYMPIIVHDIQRYLNLVDMLIDFESGTSVAAIKAKRTFELTSNIDMTDAIVRAKFEQVLADLVADTTIQIGQTQADYILALGSKLITKAEKIGISIPIYINMITGARI